jgi:hypothetical protein
MSDPDARTAKSYYHSRVLTITKKRGISDWPIIERVAAAR